MNAPKLNPDGSCPDCSSGWQCDWHQAEGVLKFSAKLQMMAEVAKAQQTAEMDRICARYELESDEFSTAEEKARRIYDGVDRYLPG